MALLYTAGFDFLPEGDDTDKTNLMSTMGWYNLPDGAFPPEIYFISSDRFDYGNYLAFRSNPNGNGHASHFFPDGNARSEAYMGVALYADTNVVSNMEPFFELSYNGDIRLRVVLKPLGIFEVYDRQENLVFQSNPATFYNAAWNYWEIGAKLADDTTGWITVRLNTVPVLALVDQATADTGYTTCNSITVGNNSDAPSGGIGDVYSKFDDIYVTDETGSQNVGFLGNVRVQSLLPDGDSGVQDFNVEPVENDNWESANNVELDGTRYVYSGVTDAQDKYTISSMVNTPVVFGVQVSGCYRQDDATQRSVANVIDSNGTEEEGDPYFTPGNFTFSVDIFETDPDTDVAWLYTAVNALLIGPKVKS